MMGKYNINETIPYINNVVHNRVLVIGRKVVVAGDGGHWSEQGEVVLTGL